MKLFLIKIYTNEPVEDRLTFLNSQELMILKSIIYRKFRKELRAELRSFHLEEEIKKLIEKGALKKPRPEERYKFIFKRCFRKLRDNFKG